MQGGPLADYAPVTSDRQQKATGGGTEKETDADENCGRQQLLASGGGNLEVVVHHV